MTNRKGRLGASQGKWAPTMTPEQQAAVYAVIGTANCRSRKNWFVYYTPTTRTPTYIECRFRTADGRLVHSVQVWPPTPPAA